MWGRSTVLASGHGMNFVADFEEAEFVEVFGVFDDVAVDAGEERCPHQFLAGGDGIQNPDMVFDCEAESAGDSSLMKE